ncbi:ATP-dependent Clp protease ATP-binding subunit [Gramella sp. BOM4]|nr:ATP-dependent Clp protease ATP-binding subunit [Christiangramia bathymodioli]
MERVLLFYEKEDYYDYKDSKSLEGYSIISITKFIHNLSLISELYPETLIVDLSALTEYTTIQSVSERIIYQFKPETILICDKAKQEKLEYELRFIIDRFENINRASFTDKERKITVDTEDENLITKRHRKIIDLDESELEIFFEKFRKRLYGHAKFKDDFEEQVRTFRVFNKLKEHKILSLFLMGESGVGKTEVARTIFDCLQGNKKLAKINFGNYSNEFSLSSLIGSARGYIGSEDGEIFMKVRETDVGVLLIDEFEKSNSALFNYFLEVLESGKMTSSLGEEMDINGFIIVFTSNIPKSDFQKRISPELRSRFDYKCIFTLLSDVDKRKYIEFRAKSIGKKVRSELGIEISDKLIPYLISQINVSSYKNMRDINKELKKEFLKFLTAYQNSIDEIDNNTSPQRTGLAKRFLSLFEY